ncbi:hypothetical protein [Actinomadura sp. NBRC 104425]|uniref:hypothetical protein n=1 Tax=Actinomadura sp. NBRC 104425 TaxID=3032204 RepID=UPI002552229F|nr:hypothetical protein [Actinomadura sp. NBRC 104425]
MPRDVRPGMPGAVSGSATQFRGHGQPAGFRIAPRSSTGSTASTSRHRAPIGTIAHQEPVAFPYHAGTSGNSRLIHASAARWRTSDGGMRHGRSPVIARPAV